MRGEFGPQSLHAGGGGGGHDVLNVGKALFQGADQLGAQVDLADADGVHPESVAVGNGLPELGIVESEAFGKAVLPMPAPPHSHEVIRRRQRKEHGK